MINSRIEKLIEYVKTIRDKKSSKEIYEANKIYIDNLQPKELFIVFKTLLDQGESAYDILSYLDKVINVFYHTLDRYKIESSNHEFIKNLNKNNKWLENQLEEIKSILKQRDITKYRSDLLTNINELEKFHTHYTIKENILFPYLEKYSEEFEGISIMWALHDEVKKIQRRAVKLLNDGGKAEDELHRVIGEIFFGYLGILQKEELILFPTANEILSSEEWALMHVQSLEFDWPLINIDREAIKKDSIKESMGDFFSSSTGNLTIEQLNIILKSLGVDFTFVDKYNKVQFFSDNEDRIFPRSPAIIGRDVKNCHPPDSVHIVEEILDKFKSGERSSASFWININEKTILIKYLALKSENNEYFGTLEVSQDITDIKKVEGEQRLLDWEARQ